jgi:hypothetical protein
MRDTFTLPLTFITFTWTTFTLNNFSTALPIAIALASSATSNVYLFDTWRFAAFSVNRIVDIRCDYFGCPEFWDVDINYQRAKITQAGVDYVNLHFDVFNILFEGS